MRAFLCDKCGESVTRKKGVLGKEISFDGQRGPRTLSVDLLYRCVHSANREHRVDFCDDCLLWLLEEYKGSIMVEVGREKNVTEDSPEHASA